MRAQEQQTKCFENFECDLESHRRCRLLRICISTLFALVLVSVSVPSVHSFLGTGRGQDRDRMGTGWVQDVFTLKFFD